METRPEHSDDDIVDRPLIVLPPTGETPNQNLAFGAGTIVGTPVLPEFVPSDLTEMPSLAQRVETHIAADGRFSPLLTTLIFSVSENSDTMTISGPAPDRDVKDALLREISHIPGVVHVIDSMT